jgi:hypothetical protein
VRIEHCNFVRREDLDYLYNFLSYGNLFNRLFLVLNPEFNTFSLGSLSVDYPYLFLGYGSDSPVYDLDLKDSIFRHFNFRQFYLKQNDSYELVLEYIAKVFRNNELLFINH